MKKRKRTFTAKCPVCGKIIKGYDDWDVGDICIAGYCPKCKRHFGEDEVSWEREEL